MIYLEEFMTLQMGHIGQYKGVYNTSEGLYGTRKARMNYLDVLIEVIGGCS